MKFTNNSKYLIVDPDRRTVEIYQIINGMYKLQFADLDKPYAFDFPGCTADIIFDDIWQ